MKDYQGTGFQQHWQTLDWDDISLRINSKTAADVERALNAPRVSREDFMALISPAAINYLEPMAQKAQQLTRQRFGNTVSFLPRSISPTSARTNAPTVVSR